jgi:hypothetical protein
MTTNGEHEISTKNDQAWRRNTPEQRAKRRAAWGNWTPSQPRESEQRWNGVTS